MSFQTRMIFFFLWNIKATFLKNWMATVQNANGNWGCHALKRSKHHKSSMWLVHYITNRQKSCNLCVGEQTEIYSLIFFPSTSTQILFMRFEYAHIQFWQTTPWEPMIFAIICINLHAWHYIWFASMQNFSWGRGDNYYIPFSFWYNTHTHIQNHSKVWGW